MYDYFKTVAYPLKGSDWNYFSDTQNNILKSTIIDFDLKLYLYSAPQEERLTTEPRVVLSKIQVPADNSSLNITLDIYINELVASGTLSFLNDSVANEEFVRIYFSNNDFSNILLAGLTFNGFICLNKYSNLINFMTNQEFNTPNIEFEPTTINVFSRHRVNKITCINSKPLIKQTSTSIYEQAQNPVSGNVKFVPGNNCTISVRPQINTIVISAVSNANDTPEETCGVWKDKIPNSKDLLCSEVIYSIAGAKPNDFGNVEISANSPLTVNALPKNNLPNPFKTLINGSNPGFSHIMHYIYIGFPQSDNNSSVFDCPTE
jgi:hypothetical protein